MTLVAGHFCLIASLYHTASSKVTTQLVKPFQVKHCLVKRAKCQLGEQLRVSGHWFIWILFLLWCTKSLRRSMYTRQTIFLLVETLVHFSNCTITRITKKINKDEAELASPLKLSRILKRTKWWRQNELLSHFACITGKCRASGN